MRSVELQNSADLCPLCNHICSEVAENIVIMSICLKTAGCSMHQDRHKLLGQMCSSCFLSYFMSHVLVACYLLVFLFKTSGSTCLKLDWQTHSMQHSTMSNGDSRHASVPSFIAAYDQVLTDRVMCYVMFLLHFKIMEFVCFEWYTSVYYVMYLIGMYRVVQKTGPLYIFPNI